MKKVGMFLETDFPPDPRVENEALSLIKIGHSIHLFCLNYKKSAPTFEVINGIHVHRYTASNLIYKLSALVYTLPFYKWLITPLIKKFLKEVNPDVLHIHDMILAESVMEVNRSELPCILDLHENRPAIMKFYQHVNEFPGKYLINLAKWNKKQKELIRRADHTIVVTNEAKEYFCSQFKISSDKLIVVPNTVDLDVFLKYPIDEKIKKRFAANFNILYLGDTGLRRGLMTALEAIAVLREIIPEIKLIIVGKSSSDDLLEQKAKELDVMDLIAFEGWQDLSLFPSYIEAADICISPIHRNLHHDTTYANKIFQYMAVGRPQVVSDCPPQAAIVSELNIGLVHKSEDVAHFNKCVKNIYEDAKLRQDMRERSKVASKSIWNWEKTGTSLTDLYQKL